MLWTSWKENRNDEKRRTNLYRGIARIMLDLARVPQPRIGSWTLNDSGVLSLTNRPISDLTFFWNRHQIPTGVPRVRLLKTSCYVEVILTLLEYDLHLHGAFHPRHAPASRPPSPTSTKRYPQQERWHLPNLSPCSSAFLATQFLESDFPSRPLRHGFQRYASK